MINEITINADQLDELEDNSLLEFVGSLEKYANDSADASYTAEYLDADGEAWELPCYLLVVGTRAIMWTQTDEAGTQDVTVVGAMCEEDLAEQVEEFARDIAGGLHNPLEWVSLGYGEEDEVVKRLPSGGEWVLVLDEPAAEAGKTSCWFACLGNDEHAARVDYQLGGTVSGIKAVSA